VLVGTEGEPFAAIGQAVKAQSPWPATWFGGYTGGWAGYVPTADAYPLGGYEVDTSPFTPGAADRLVAGTLAALGHPLLLSASNKPFLGALLGLSVEDRRTATHAAHAIGIIGGCRILRAHDVRGARRTADVLAAVLGRTSQVPG